MKHRILERLGDVCYNIQGYYLRIIRTIKDSYHQHTRGYTSDDMFCFTETVADWMLPRLNYIKNNHKYYPNWVEHLTPDISVTLHNKVEMAEELWHSILDDIIYAFEFIIKEGEIFDDCIEECGQTNLTAYETALARHKKGMQLFAVYYMYL